VRRKNVEEANQLIHTTRSRHRFVCKLAKVSVLRVHVLVVNCRSRN
jgi:hypothetical protein